MTTHPHDDELDDLDLLDALLTRLAELNPEALLLEPRRIYDGAIVGITNEADDDWDREPGHWVAVYDEQLCIDLIMDEFDCDYGTAADWFYTNTYGSWQGEGTPTFRPVVVDGWVDLDD